jgi:paraquat-inducible protein A
MLRACPDCDLLLEVQPLAVKETAICPRCHARIDQAEVSLSLLLSLTLVGLLLWFMSLSMPLLRLQLGGVEQSLTFTQATWVMFQEREWLLALLIGLTTILAPLLHLSGLLWLLLPITQGKVPYAVGWVFRSVLWNHTWLMLDVFFLGVLITAVKLADTAQIIPSWSLLSLFGLIVVMSVTQMLFDADHYWRRVAQLTKGE